MSALCISTLLHKPKGVHGARRSPAAGRCSQPQPACVRGACCESQHAITALPALPAPRAFVGGTLKASAPVPSTSSHMHGMTGCISSAQLNALSHRCHRFVASPEKEAVCSVQSVE